MWSNPHGSLLAICKLAFNLFLSFQIKDDLGIFYSQQQILFFQDQRFDIILNLAILTIIDNILITKKKSFVVINNNSLNRKMVYKNF